MHLFIPLYISNKHYALNTQRSELSTQHLALSFIHYRHTVYKSIYGFCFWTINNVFPDLVCAVHYETSPQFVASFLDIPLVVEIFGNF